MTREEFIKWLETTDFFQSNVTNGNDWELINYDQNTYDILEVNEDSVLFRFEKSSSQGSIYKKKTYSFEEFKNLYESDDDDLYSDSYTWEEAHQKAFTVRWKVGTCNSPNCWCGTILPEEDIFDKDGNQIYIVTAGAMGMLFAKYIVELHNQELNER